jgi:3-keto-L-gulonate-6-phosphate decarboxylase
VIVELTGIKDVLAEAAIWRDVGVERMVYHRGWDEGNLSRTWDSSDRQAIEALIDMGFKLSIAGGIDLETLPFFEGLRIAVFVIGRAIRETPDPEQTARRFRTRIDEIWVG